MTTAAMGIDLGGTNVRAALVAPDGRILVSAREALQDRSPQAAVGTIVAAVRACLARAGDASPSAYGVGVAAQLKGDVVAVAPNLGWRDVPIGALLRGALGHPVRLANDLSACAWGELKAGAAKGQTDTFTVFVGTGVGSAVIAGGRLVSGAWGVAGEFGHVKVVPEGGRACGCGEHGCLEAYVGGQNLQKWMADEGLAGTPADLENAAREGNMSARSIYDFAVVQLALAIANQVTVLNPGALVLGGGVLRNCPGMVEVITACVGRRSARVAREGLRVVQAALGDDAGAVGAALLALDAPG